MRKAYGVEWPDELTDLEIELVCFRDGHESKSGGLGREGHFRKAVGLLWPDLKWNYWLDATVASYCRFEVTGLTGCGSAGKTFGAALCALVDWLSSPMETSVILTSTTVPALRVRIWGDVKKLWTAVQGLPGNLVDSSNRLEAFKGNDKSAIRGIAVKDGSVEKAVGNIQGVHNRRVIVIIDEMPQTPRAIVTAASNLSKGTEWFRFIGIGNAVNRFDQHGRMCEPITGWDTVNEAMQFWLTKGGVCLHFDGLQSPNITSGFVLPADMAHGVWQTWRERAELASRRKRLLEIARIAPGTTQAQIDAINIKEQGLAGLMTPDELHASLALSVDAQDVEQTYVKHIGTRVDHPHLITAQQIMDEEQRTSRDSPEWWMYVRGFWPPDGILNTVFTQTMLAKVPEVMAWREEQEQVGAMDPAFGGGDRCVIKFGRIGTFLQTGIPGLQLGDTVEIRANMRSPEPVHYQIAQRAVEECKKRGVAPECFAMDVTGEGGGLADIISKQWSPKFHRIEFGGSASDLLVSRHDARKGKEVYSNRVTELWFTARQFVMNGHVAGMDDETAQELVARQFVVNGRTYTVESKILMKSRAGKSPDLGDTFVILCYLMRLRGVVPGQSLRSLRSTTTSDKDWVAMCRKHDIYSGNQMA